MDNLSYKTLVSGGVDTSCEGKEQDPNSCVSGEGMVQKLGVTFDVAPEVDHVKPESSRNCLSDKDDDDDLQDKNKAGDLNHGADVSSAGNSGRCLSKCATFPVSGYEASKLAEGEDKNSDSLLQDNASFSRSLSLPTPRKLVSAMKGGREREGMAPKKLSVAWAPDVYDPPPTSVSHNPKRKTQQQYRNSKKHGKGKQKGKNTRNGGGSPKDKKHNRKVSVAPECRLGSFSNADLAFSRNSTTVGELVDFAKNEDGTDSSCASSFLRKSCGTLRVAYAEAM